MPKEYDMMYKSLLDAHIANLYMFYLKLFKYEKAVRTRMNRDISQAVNDAIDSINVAIKTGENVYEKLGTPPELSISYLTRRATIAHGNENFYEGALEAILEDDQLSIEETLDLTIKYSKGLKLEEDSGSLSATQKMIHDTFKKLQYVLQ